MVREFQNESASQESASAKNYRFDAARRGSNRSSSAEVPVLFRLQNLQRNPEVSLATTNSAPVSLNSASQQITHSAVKTSPSLNREAQPHPLRSLESKPKTPDTSVQKVDPIVPTIQNDHPQTTSTSTRPWSTNVILLAIGVAVVFLLFKQNPSQPSLASSIPSPTEGEKTLKPLIVSVTSTAASASAVEGLSTADGKSLTNQIETPKDDKFHSIEPLAAPKLPAPMVLATEQPSSTSPSSTSLVQHSADIDSGKNTSEPTVRESRISMDLPADDSPSMPLEDVTSEYSTAPHRSVMIPSDSAVVDRTPSKALNLSATESRLPGNDSVLYRQPTPTIVTNPHVAASPTTEQEAKPTGNQREEMSGSPPQAQLVSTTSPELETAELFKLRERYLRANMESQQQAIVGNRQPMTGTPVPQWSNNASNFGPPTKMVSGPTQSAPSYVPPSTAQRPVYQQQPVQVAPIGYGGAGTNPPTASSQNGAPSNQSYVPISGSFTPEGFVEDTNYPTQPQPQVPTSGGYQPLSPQFQSQPMNGN